MHGNDAVCRWCTVKTISNKSFKLTQFLKNLMGEGGIEWLISQQMMSTCVNCSRNIQFSFFISLHVQLSKAN